MASDGITRLIQVTQQKSQNANEEAMEGANKQSSLIKEQKSLRGVQSTFESSVKDTSLTGASGIAKAADLKKNAGAIASEASVGKPAAYLTRFSKSGFEKSSPFSAAGLAKSLDNVASSPTHYASGLNAFVEALKKSFEKSVKDLEGQDKLGNFEIQSLMSNYNEAETLATSTKKKTDDQKSSVLSKI